MSGKIAIELEAYNGVEDSTKIEVPFSASIPSGDSFVYSISS